MKNQLHLMAAGVMALLLLCSAQSISAQVKMSDSEVLEYAKQGVSEGKSQTELIKELAAKGVDRAQAERVKALYESQSAGAQGAAGAQVVVEDVQGNSHTVNGEVSLAPETATSTQTVVSSNEVYGRSIFKNKQLNFAPSENLATPRNYRLGPGDEVIIDIFGANQATIRGHISPEGSINIDILGPIYLNGMTIDEANAYLHKRLSQIYGGLNNGTRTDIRLSLGQIRTIQVNVVGEVTHPGTYVLSSFSTIFHALYMAGGIVEPGTLRSIQLVRDGEVVCTSDVYEFLLTGSLKNDMRLEEGDVILVSSYKSMVSVSGAVKRPMLYELKEGETVADLLNFCGGFANSAYTESLTITRQNGKAYEIKTVAKSQFDSFVLCNGDEVKVDVLQSRFENKIAIRGAVFIPGTYELGEGVHTVRQLVEVAGGLLPEAFLNRAVVHREHDDRSMETFSVNLGKIMAGSIPDFELQNRDELFISSEYDLTDQGTMSISGWVKAPGTFTFAKNTTVEDLIILAGGLKDGASLSRVDVNRRNKDEKGMTISSEIAQVFSFPIKEGFVSDGEDFYLEPYDEVIVRKSPSYSEQLHFTVEGETNFPGSYTMSTRNDRLTDLVARSGGVTDYAYVKGARIFRRMNDDEARLWADKINALEAISDSVTITKLRNESVYPIAINLDKALADPQSDFNILLRDGDRLVIPTRSHTVKVQGGVMMPNTLTYDQSWKARDYIKACGGFAPRTRRHYTYIIHVNGSTERYRPYARMEPGSEIVVPLKDEVDKAARIARIQAIGSATSGIGTMLAYLLVAITKL